MGIGRRARRRIAPSRLSGHWREMQVAGLSSDRLAWPGRSWSRGRWREVAVTCDLHRGGCRRRRPVERHVRADQTALRERAHQRELSGENGSADDLRKAASVLPRVSRVRAIDTEHGQHGELGRED